MIADNARVADLLVAKGQLIVGETNRAGVVCELGMLQCARVQRDGPRLLALGMCNPAVQTPECGQLRVGDSLLKCVGRSAKRRRRLSKVVLEEPCLGQGGSDPQFIFAIEGARSPLARASVG